VLGGDIERLRGRLKVPRAELDAWLQGTARPPDAVFLLAVDIIVESEAIEQRRAHRVEFTMGHEQARCPNCDTTFFSSPVPEGDIKNVTRLSCLACGLSIVRSDLMAYLSSDLAKRGAARMIALRRMLGTSQARRQDDTPKAEIPDPTKKVN
jgi:hypothetical protein